MDWYLVIPWILGGAAWSKATKRRMERPLLLGAAFFLVGCGVVLLFDFGLIG